MVSLLEAKDQSNQNTSWFQEESSIPEHQRTLVERDTGRLHVQHFGYTLDIGLKIVKEPTQPKT